MALPTRIPLFRTGLLTALALVGGSLRAAGPASAAVDFNRDIRPILSDACYHCHGPDQARRKADLRLDTEEGARAALEPGKPDDSELFLRVTHRNEKKRMPPPASGRQLDARQVELLRRWIEQGAKWQKHWAFLPPQRPALPPVKNTAWPRNGIDQFILARLEREGLAPSPEADRTTLIRRVTLDLTGLPPTPAEVDAFLNDQGPDAYEKLVDRLLANPRYGERMAARWLDAARYADTNGYQTDGERHMWRWRDWVIAAFNANQPFDQFTIEQIAGDLLPGATLDQKIATGFNRNHPINYEGGAIPEEYHAAYIFDRIDTTATVWMGLTLRCTQCHDHKYDPFTQKDFYRLYAFFHNVPEQGLDGQKGNAVPFMKLPDPSQEAEMNATQAKVSELEAALKARATATETARAEWEVKTAAALDRVPVVSQGLLAHFNLDEKEGAQAADATGRQPAGAARGKPAWTPGKVGGALKLDGETHVDLASGIDFDRDSTFSYGAWVNPAGRDHMAVLARMDDAQGYRGWDLYLGDGKVWVHLIHEWEKDAIRVISKRSIEPETWRHVFVTYDGSGKAKGVKLYIDGRPAEVEVSHDTLTGSIRTALPPRIGRRHDSAAFRGMIDDVRIYDRELSPEEVEQIAGFNAVREILAVAADQRTKEQKESLTRYYLETFDAPYRSLSRDLAEWKKKQEELEKAIPTSMVMEEMAKPRETFMLVRGQYDRKGEKVTPGTPAMLPPLPKDAPPNRLGLARWLVSPQHPLTARVAVNHFWQMHFGTGLVKTAEDFGSQGERPSHPELLDWLATEFIRTGWDVKAMQRLMVTSAAFRQSSRLAPRLREKDPENRLLARGPRVRLPAEFIRDQALAASGLLVRKIGGPSVRPYHPPGLWEEIAFGAGFTAQKYEQDKGEALYRRSLYTFWKRTCPPPSLQAFDAPEREFCMVRRSVTNTPLQALVLMNDPTYVEAARKLAERVLKEAPASPTARLTHAFRLTLARRPRYREIAVLLRVLNEQLTAFRTDAAAAEKLLAVGESPRDLKFSIPELAAWTTVASVLLNLDETITNG